MIIKCPHILPEVSWGGETKLPLDENHRSGWNIYLSSKTYIYLKGSSYFLPLAGWKMTEIPVASARCPLQSWHQGMDAHFPRERLLRTHHRHPLAITLTYLLKVFIHLLNYPKSSCLRDRHRHFYSQRQLRALVRMLFKLFKQGKMTSISFYKQGTWG